MLTTSLATGQCQIVLRPNRSSNWPSNRLMVLLIAVQAFAISAGFALAGAWMIFPFAGLEIACLTLVLHHVNRRLATREVITLEEDWLALEKGTMRPQHRWRFRRSDASVAVHLSAFPHDPPLISICDGPEQVGIGAFLSREEGEELLLRLHDCGLRVRRHGEPGLRRF